jgi:predicted RNase H-like HicB family nuclease
VKTYDLYLESGPKHKKTMVHLFDPLGCIANGATTEEAIAAAPAAILMYLRFLKRHGEKVDPNGSFKTRVAQHIAETAIFIGQGSSYITFDPDLRPVTAREIETAIHRFHAMRETLANWADSQTDKQLDSMPKLDKRPARNVMVHMLNGSGYLTPIVGTIKDLSSIQNAVERREVSLSEALRAVDTRVAEVLRAATPEQRRAVVQRPNEVRTMRNKANDGQHERSNG